METTTINIAPGNTISGELYKPAGIPNGGVVVIAYGSDGMKEPWASMIREYARELSARNYSALIPDYLKSTGTAPGPDVFAQIPVNLPKWQSAVDSAITHAAAPRIALLGFSLGGHLCLRLRHRAMAVVEFFAPELLQLGGLGAAVPASPHVQIHHGKADTLVPYANATRIDRFLKSHGTAPELYSYAGAGHGFAGSDPKNASARRLAKERTLAFIATHL